MSRINLFNEKTMYEIYDFDINMHVDFDKNICRATMISKEKTLGPRAVYTYVKYSDTVPTKYNMQEYIKNKIQAELIHYLNQNVGIECLMKKEEIPKDIYWGVHS